MAEWMATDRVYMDPYYITDPQLEGPSPSSILSPFGILGKEPNPSSDGDRSFPKYTHIQTKKNIKSQE